ncbi:MAG: acyltransferase family protein, partial [Eubacteriales bacterium]|nr:acyltransferase family protein [Eubacteriales bacterium]
MKKLITGSRNRPGLDAAKKADRSSNIELLRIAAMALIVSNHLVNHGILKVTSAAPYELWPQGSVLNRMVCAAFSTGGRIGVAVFFMITGYFLAGRERFSWNPLIRLLIKVHFFAALDFVIFLLFRALIGYGKSFSISEMALKSFVIPITLWWFALAYAVLILLAPFINRGIRWLGRVLRGAAYPLLILVFWCLYAVGMTWSVYIIIRAVFFYLIGAMIGTM